MKRWLGDRCFDGKNDCCRRLLRRLMLLLLSLWMLACWMSLGGLRLSRSLLRKSFSLRSVRSAVFEQCAISAIGSRAARSGARMEKS